MTVDGRQLTISAKMAKHLAILDKEAAEVIFDGRKKVEARFSQIKIPPFGKVSSGDVVLMKLPGEKIVGQFLVGKVIYFDHPTTVDIEEIKKKYAKALALPNSFWLDHEKINYITLMFIKTVTKFIIEPQVKKKDLRGWVVLE